MSIMMIDRQPGHVLVVTTADFTRNTETMRHFSHENWVRSEKAHEDAKHDLLGILDYRDNRGVTFWAWYCKDCDHLSFVSPQ